MTYLPRALASSRRRLLLLLGVSGLAAGTIRANTFSVNLGGDEGTGVGFGGDIRSCINAANANPGSNITFIPRKLG